MNSPIRAVKNRIAVARSLYSFVDLVKHPEHLDRVFEISASLAEQRVGVLEKMRDHFAKTPNGAAALRERYRLHVDLTTLSLLPLGTLGRGFADHMRRNNLDPAAIPVLPGDGELEFVRAHLYETHDLWHAVTGFDTDAAGELGLQAFYAAQVPGGLPLLLLAMGFLNTAIYALDEREQRLNAVVRGWDLGRRARPLFGVQWDRLWATPMAEVRSSFGLEPYDAGTQLAAA